MASQPFFTVDPQVFRHGPPSTDDLTEIFFFICPFSPVLFFFSMFVFYLKSATIVAFYVMSSHLISIYYLCPQYVYVPQHFSVDTEYSRHGPLGIPIGKLWCITGVG